MSKKVVPFRMPPQAALPSGTSQARIHGATVAPNASEPDVPDAPSAKPRARRAISSKADQWVQLRESATSANAASMSLNLDALANEPIAVRRLTINLTAERDWQEVVALSLFIPPMLGWFWLFNIACKYWSPAR
jgi:hypothetical protein